MKVIFSTNFRPKTKKIVRAVFEKNIKVSDFGLIWRRFRKYLQFFFKNPALSLFYLYSPLTSCKKSEKFLEPFLRKLCYQPTNQPTNYYQQNRLYRTWLTPVQKSYKFTLNPQFWSFLSDIWRGVSRNLYKIFSWNFQYYNILYIVTTWQIFIRLWDGPCPSLKNLHHFAWNDPGVF